MDKNIEIIDSINQSINFTELAITLKKYGIENVRGASNTYRFTKIRNRKSYSW
jgi:hypothetical protein